MTVLSGQVSCSAVATLVVAAADANAGGYLTQSELAKRPGRTVVLLNISAQAVFIGDSTVTSASGYQLAQNQSVTIVLHPLDNLYGRTASATATVHYLTSE